MEGGASAGADSRIGVTLDGRYRIDRRIGAGGFGVVYEAEHVVIRRKVAIKMLHAHVAAEADLLARFKREAIAATATGHPHIVEVFDMGRAPDGAAFMVLELLTGKDWGADLDETGAQPLGRTAKIVGEVLDALQAAHDKGIVHRDLKPENVFLVTRGTDRDFVKLVDFGISKMRDEGGGATGGAMTHTGMALGTPVAMAPEQFAGKSDVDLRADLWAVGVMLYRALTAHLPFTGDTFALLAVNVMTEEPVSIATLRPDLPADVVSLVHQLLEKKRERRPKSAAEVRAVLARHEGDVGAAPIVRPSLDPALMATQAATNLDSKPAGAVGPNRTAEATPPETSAPGATTAPATSRPGGSRMPLALLAFGLATVLVVGGAWALTGGLGETTPPPVEPIVPVVVAPEVRETPTDDERPAPAADAHLVLWTTPSCLVSLAGEPLGFTPLTVDLPAGTHTLSLESPADHVSTTHEVTLVAGETTREVLELTPATGRRPHGTHGETHETSPEVAVEAPPPPEVHVEPPPPAVEPAPPVVETPPSTGRTLRRPN